MSMSDRVRVRFGWSADPLDSLAGVSWTDETTKVRSVTVSRGRSSWPGEWPAGVAVVVLDNSTGTLDITDGTYGARLKPGRPVNVQGKNSSATWVDLFTGYVRPRQGYAYTDRTNDSTLTVHAVDIIGILAEVGFTGLTASAGDANTFIDEALTDAGFGSIDTDLDAGVAVLDVSIESGAVRTGGINWTSNLLSWCQQAARSDGGEVYANKSGQLVFDDRHAVQSTTRLNTSQFTITDDGAAGTLAARHDSIARTFGDRPATAVKVRAADGTETLQTGIGDLPYVATTYDVTSTFLLNDDPEGVALAAWWLAQLNVLDSYPATATVAVAGPAGTVDDDHLDKMCGVELRDRVTFEHTVPGLSQESHTVTVESIVHDVTPSLWSTTLGFLSAAYVDNTGYTNWLILDSGTKGQLDDEILGY